MNAGISGYQNFSFNEFGHAVDRVDGLSLLHSVRSIFDSMSMFINIEVVSSDLDKDLIFF